MAKKLLCVVLSIVMVLGTFAVAVNAADEDYKKLIDTQFLFAYGVNDAEAFDEAVAQKNLSFWKDEIITAYNAAETAEDWEALYNKMCTPHMWTDEDGLSEEFKEMLPDGIGLDWPEYRSVNEGKANVDIKLVADKQYAMPGDTVKISCYITTDFNAWTMDSGLFYDIGKAEYVSTVFDPNTDSKLKNWTLEATDNWCNYNGLDFRSTGWPPSMRENQNNCFETRKALYHSVKPNFALTCGTGDNQYINPIFEETLMWVAEFKIADTVAIGDVLNFSAPVDDAGCEFDQFEFYTSGMADNNMTLYKTTRAASATNETAVDYMTEFEIDYTVVENAAVTIGEEPAPAEPADYDALDAAIAELDTLNAADYYNWADYANAVEAGKAVARDLTTDDQAIIDAAAKAITDAKAALKKFANYADLDAAIAELDTLNAADYYNWADYANAVEAGKAVAKGLSEDDQAIIDAAVKAIADAKAALIGFANYKALDEAIDKNLDKNYYTQDSWVAYAAAIEAGKAVERGLSANDQAIVDAATKAIADAEAALEGLASYIALDAAINEFDNTTLNANEYVNWADYAAAVEAGKAIDRDLATDEQATINNAAKAITDAKAALVKKAIESVTANKATSNTNTPIKVKVVGAPNSIKIKDAEGAVTTFTRDDAVITTTANGEEWTIELYVGETTKTYDVFAVYADGFIAESVTLTIEVLEEGALDLGIYSIEIPDMYPDKQNGGTILAGKHDIIIRTGKDVHKIQFMTADGATYTYAPWYTTVIEDGDQLVWTINHSFGPLGDWSMDIRTRATTTTFAATGSTLDATVLY